MSVMYQGATEEAIKHHYDVSNDFFALWLDASLTYTCALWDDERPADEAEPETLESAQARKLDYLIEGSRAASAQRVLDVGCGWGSLLKRLQEVYGVRQAVGLTLSDTQAELGRALELPRTDIRVENWRDHEPAAGYDAIISIGAFEHFAKTGLTRAERVSQYREFFERCYEWLPSHGRIALQTNVKGNNRVMDKATVRELMFIIETIFPESEIPALSEVTESSEKLFDVVSMRNDPDHYSRTCGEWLRRLRARRDEAVASVGEENVANYEHYLGACVRHFRNRHLGLARIILEKGR
ncbi:class I SAM-dependent methyltransferase [Streptomyces sp. AJS327]|uniref:SAM-dependent methyltransferase n=1 Tax=Streptomyces sp. AJS327 TaxID=2545265 RepID=UPI0015DFD4FB|nr:cyclopropane-fatty-acyl-phospholipid synthase family protein [Streptomyces sp. AJS327]MBA0053334.1 class I SAM-dependent methyltransferase [Streptomyces sp. AJS327]